MTVRLLAYGANTGKRDELGRSFGVHEGYLPLQTELNGCLLRNSTWFEISTAIPFVPSLVGETVADNDSYRYIITPTDLLVRSESYEVARKIFLEALELIAAKCRP